MLLLKLETQAQTNQWVVQIQTKLPMRIGHINTFVIPTVLTSVSVLKHFFVSSIELNDMDIPSIVCYDLVAVVVPTHVVCS